MKCPLYISKNIPDKARTVPQRNNGRFFIITRSVDLKNGLTISNNNTVNIGVVQTIKETLLVLVNSNAVFSVKKYNDPPVIPVRKSLISSENELLNNFFEDMNHIPI